MYRERLMELKKEAEARLEKERAETRRGTANINRPVIPGRYTLHMNDQDFENYKAVIASKKLEERSLLEQRFVLDETKMEVKEFKSNFSANSLKLLDMFNSVGKKAYLVGGCVRDAFLGRESHDEDIATEMSPDEVKELLINNGIQAHRIIDTGLQHGTITVMMQESGKLVGYEITTFRMDGEYENSHKPNSVTFINSFLEDTKRRDFTINAIGYNPVEGVVDYHNGVEDLKAGIIRTVGDPVDRFGEDALRMMRAVRFSSQLNFKIDESIIEAILGENPKNPGHKMYEKMSEISAERILAELTKTLMSPFPGKGIKSFSTLHLLDVISPYFYEMFQCEQNNRYHYLNVGDHTCETINNTQPILELRFAAMLHDIGKVIPGVKTTDTTGEDHFYGTPENRLVHAIASRDESKIILKKLKAPNALRDMVLFLVENHDIRPNPNKKSVAEYILSQGKGFTMEMMHLLMDIQRADAYAQKADMVKSRFGTICKTENIADEIMMGPYLDKDLAINANDIVKIKTNLGGFPVNFNYPEVPAIREELLRHVILEPEMNNTYDLCEYIRAHSKSLKRIGLAGDKTLKDDEREAAEKELAARRKFEKAIRTELSELGEIDFESALKEAKEDGVLYEQF